MRKEVHSPERDDVRLKADRWEIAERRRMRFLTGATIILGALLGGVVLATIWSLALLSTGQ